MSTLKSGEVVTSSPYLRACKKENYGRACSSQNTHTHCKEGCGCVGDSSLRRLCIVLPVSLLHVHRCTVAVLTETLKMEIPNKS